MSAASETEIPGPAALPNPGADLMTDADGPPPSAVQTETGEAAMEIDTEDKGKGDGKDSPSAAVAAAISPNQAPASQPPAAETGGEAGGGNGSVEDKNAEMEDKNEKEKAKETKTEEGVGEDGDEGEDGMDKDRDGGNPEPDATPAPEGAAEGETQTQAPTETETGAGAQPDEGPDAAAVEAQREQDRKRRREVLDSMVSIEAEFSALKERLFSEKIKETQREVDMVKNETHDEFLDQVRRLRHIREQKIAAAERWRRYQIQAITEMFDAEKRTINCEFEAEKGILRDRLLVALSDKRRKLEEEKHTLNLTDNDVGTESRALKRSLRRRDRDTGDGGAYVRAYPGEGLPPPQALGMSASVTAGPSLGLGGEGGASLRRLNKPPHVSYSLREQEVLEDLAQINMDLGRGRSGAAGDGTRGGSYVKDIDVHTDRGYLFYGDQVFERGMTVDIEGPTNSAGRGIIWSINDNEVTIRFPDDKRGTIYTSLLRAGKYTLHEV